MNNKVLKRRLSPVQIITLGFLLIIFLSSLILSLPVASANHQNTNYIDALFTATTSVCVTGLVTVTTATHWSLFAKILILILIQVGGLGFMTAITLIFGILKRKMTVTNKLTASSMMNTTDLNNLSATVRKVIICTFTIEFIGATLLFFAFTRYYDYLTSFKFAIFTSISAFCNAGLDIMSLNSLIIYNQDAVILWTVMILIIFGGIGFPIWLEIFEIVRKKIMLKKKWNIIKKGISLHFKLVMITTISLIFLGFVVIFLSEYSNPLTMQNMSLTDKINNSFFQSITTRTAGFDSIGQSNLRDSSKLISILLMFIGGSPGSTAGGIKTLTFIIIIIMLNSWLKGRNRAYIFRRNIQDDIVKRAFLITSLSMAVLFVAIMILSITENVSITTLVFECVSALATVGLSLDFTSKLTLIGKIVIILLMFMGRIGPITMFLSLIKEKKATSVIHTEEKLILG